MVRAIEVQTDHPKQFIDESVTLTPEKYDFNFSHLATEKVNQINSPTVMSMKSSLQMSLYRQGFLSPQPTQMDVRQSVNMMHESSTSTFLTSSVVDSKASKAHLHKIMRTTGIDYNIEKHRETIKQTIRRSKATSSFLG